MKNMQDFYLCTESDRAKFFEICRLIEVIFPGLEKQDLLIDFDMSMIQPYKSTDKNITIIKRNCNMVKIWTTSYYVILVYLLQFQ